MPTDLRDDPSRERWVDPTIWYDDPNGVPSPLWVSQNLSVTHPDPVRSEGWRRLMLPAHIGATYQILLVLRERTLDGMAEVNGDRETLGRRESYLGRIDRALKEVEWQSRARDLNPIQTIANLLAAIEAHRVAVSDDGDVAPEPADEALWDAAAKVRARVDGWNI